MIKAKEKDKLFNEEALNGKKKSIWAKIFFVIFIVYIALFMLFMAMFISFKVQFVCVPVQGMSMQPTINPDTTKQEETKDWVFIRKRQNIKKGDVVVFNAKGTTKDQTFIKRVIATQGDAVTICKIRTFSKEVNQEIDLYRVCLVEAEDLLDGVIQEDEVQILEEDYIDSAYDWTYRSSYMTTHTKDGVKYHNSFYNIFLSGNYQTQTDPSGKRFAIVPQGEFFYLGDNRAISSDSQERGTDKVSSVQGVVEILMPNAQEDSSPLWVQTKAVFNYYAGKAGEFFTNLWIGLENAFAI